MLTPLSLLSRHLHLLWEPQCHPGTPSLHRRNVPKLQGGGTPSGDVMEGAPGPLVEHISSPLASLQAVWGQLGGWLQGLLWKQRVLIKQMPGRPLAFKRLTCPNISSFERFFLLKSMLVLDVGSQHPSPVRSQGRTG